MTVRRGWYGPTHGGGLCALLAIACGSGAEQPAADAAVVACTSVGRTCAEITAAVAEAGDVATVTCDATTFTLRASGVPPYQSNQTTPNEIGVQDWVVTLPLTPTCAAQATGVLDSRGPIGFMVNGVAFFGPQNVDGEDAVVVEGPTLDDCDGHADMFCRYHYHSDATCVFGEGDTLEAHVQADGHPALIGFALDGFSLHAPDPLADLDACNGHVDGTRGYHYHATPTSPYFIGCFAGTAATPTADDEGCD